MDMSEEMMELMYKIMETTNTIEDFISACLEEDISYDEVLAFAKEHHKG